MTLVDSVSSRAVVAEVWYVVRSILDPRSLVSSAVMSQLLVWSVDVEVHGRDFGASVSGLALDGNSSEVEERASGSVVGVSTGSAVTLARNAPSDNGSAAADVLQVVPVASFSGVLRVSVLVPSRERLAHLGHHEYPDLQPDDRELAAYAWPHSVTSVAPDPTPASDTFVQVGAKQYLQHHSPATPDLSGHAPVGLVGQRVLPAHGLLVVQQRRQLPKTVLRRRNGRMVSSHYAW
ncbi:hypothetical protein PF001_g11521 [Phytophthora fragariae]|uniref:Uncharacterized protein n=1 Tax=Phytophthora fragariae TaxID=53985 RepID=A0A6A3F217_9STRA|nr:hypothetical protein PF009_g10605 [Phytophthora fragariae]KAE9146340.1 hypothetical protein PF006_g8875 [Phytophthora fragariae]KAE9307634.1 hypothetical protein PF001_g11521 [Phytophthora fragariae]